MKNYYNEYVRLCSDVIYNRDDYGDKKKVKANNVAIDKLFKLEKEILKNGHSDIFLKLLLHDDVVIRNVIACECISHDVYVQEAVQVLETIVNDDSLDPLFRFGSKNMLKIYYDKISSKENS